MREIKFRAWDKKNKFMDDGPFWVGEDGCVYDQASITYNTPNQEIELNEHLVLMQFTGLKDKNDKEIYEGDIVRTPDIADNLWEIYWHINGFCLGRKRKDKSVLDWPTDENGYVCYGRSWVDIEVLGNIYENPELLEEGK